MGEMLSQEEINALLRGLDDDEDTTKTKPSGNTLSDIDKDAIGEVSNISMGTAATTLFTLVNQKVVITTPTVSLVHWDDIVKEYSSPCVAIQIVYKEGLEGTNLLILKEDDVRVITDLMMGGDGSNPDAELSDLHLSAISEAMNQMIGSAATSMSSMFNKRIDIAPPISNHLDLTESFDQTELSEFLGGEFIRVSFRLQIGDLVDSEMMQLYPVEFAQKITDNFSNTKEKEEPKVEKPAANQYQQNQQASIPQPQPQMQYQQPDMNQGMNQGMMPPGYNQNGMSPSHQRNVEVQQAQFQSFDMGSFVQQKENIDLIMDVPLEVTVELGRTHKSIHDILEFAPGTIIELNKLAGEPIDVLVNGKIVAKGEVVVIDENFSIRITDIIKQAGQIL
ncbi:MAG: flagellar motor switch phosphatase FliY [Firmicutes bacterium HGW-Firmicutes-3]|jgi:flagellar motor switch protein FliN/FliY|nr:MAG: flagellar motor switch phosphatase FliY [Firmicutes bacterium HGW-Firmicutes-3]